MQVLLDDELAKLAKRGNHSSSSSRQHMLLMRYVNHSNTSKAQRALLQNDVSIRAYSSIIAATRGYSRLEVGKTAVTDSWLQGPLQWPPKFNHLADQGAQCMVLRETFDAVLQVSMMLKSFYVSDAYQVHVWLLMVVTNSFT